MLGLGEGALLTLVFNVLVTASPKELAGDVGALRGTTNNLATGLGTAIAAVLSISLLGLVINREANNHPDIPPSLIAQVPLDNVDFISNDQLEELLAATTATPDQVAAAASINEAARLRSLKITFWVLAGIALLAIIPAISLPSYKPGEVPTDLNEQSEHWVQAELEEQVDLLDEEADPGTPQAAPVAPG